MVQHTHFIAIFVDTLDIVQNVIVGKEYTVCLNSGCNIQGRIF